MFQTILNCSKEFNNCLDESINKQEPINIKKYALQYTTDVIASCAFGIECNCFKNTPSDFIRYTSKLFDPTFMDKFKFFIAYMFPKFAKFIKMRATNKDVHNFFVNLVKNTVEHREKHKIVRNDFLQILMELKYKETNKQALTLMEITAQAFLIYVAGFETSSNTISFCVLELAKNLDIQEKVRKEIVETLNKYDGNICYDALMEMHYLEKNILGMKYN